MQALLIALGLAENEEEWDSGSDAQFEEAERWPGSRSWVQRTCDVLGGTISWHPRSHSSCLEDGMQPHTPSSYEMRIDRAGGRSSLSEEHEAPEDEICIGPPMRDTEAGPVRVKEGPGWRVW
jgi:hypothetical protein